MSESVLERIRQNRDEYSKGQKAISNFILENYHTASYLTAARMAKRVGVSESTVVRFAEALGYEGYPQMQKDLQQLAKNTGTTLQRIEITNEMVDKNSVLREVMIADAENIKETLSNISEKDFSQAIELCTQAKRLYVAGVRTSSFLSAFMGLYGSLILDNVHCLDERYTEILEQLTNIGKEDVFLAFSFPRYSKKMVQVVERVKESGAKLIAITDDRDAPIARYADCLLIAKSNRESFVDSFVAPLSLVNALIVGIGMEKKEQVYHTFSHLEKTWANAKTYEQKEEEHR